MNKVNEIIKKGKELSQNNFTLGGSGNLSIRDNKYLYITKSGIRLGDLKQEDIIYLPVNEENFHSKRRGKGANPSIEGLLHIKTYEKTKAKSIIHSHPIFTSIISKNLNKLEISKDGYPIIGNKRIPIIESLEPGSKKLATKVSENLTQKNAVIVRDHGTFVKEESLEKAFKINEKIEELSKKYYLRLFL
ncbi:hypothetical protein C9439_08250 [archaeon SCG-AAA382B04]|nr:hypothetical protein C9439_08250 [archaeon SCG-AAA382B04]